MTTKNTASGTSDKAVLIKLSVPMYAGESTSRTLSKEAAAAHGADEESIKTVLKALRPETRAAIIAAKNTIRSIWIKNTLPWMDEGTRVCPVEKYAATRQAMEEAAIKFEEATRELVGKYDEIKKDAKRRLNGLWNEISFPTREDFARRFKCVIGVGLINTAADVRLDILGSEQVAKIRAEIEETVNAQLQTAQRDALIRVANAVQKMVEKMQQVDAPRGENDPTRYFKNSIIDNIVEIADEMRGMNIVGSAKLDKVLKSIKARFAKFNADEVRENKELREEAVKAGNEVLAELDGFKF